MPVPRSDDPIHYDCDELLLDAELADDELADDAELIELTDEAEEELSLELLDRLLLLLDRLLLD